MHHVISYANETTTDKGIKENCVLDAGNFTFCILFIFFSGNIRASQQIEDLVKRIIIFTADLRYRRTFFRTESDFDLSNTHVNPARTSMRVDFPAPEGPKIAVNSPDLKFPLMVFNSCRVPNGQYNKFVTYEDEPSFYSLL